MRSMWKSVAGFGILAAVSGNVANAADVAKFPGSSAPPPLLQSAPLLVDEFGSGWYLRGDIGYRKNDIDEVRNDGRGGSVAAPDLDRSWAFGGGGGYKWDWFRADITIDYSKADFTSGGRIFSAKLESITGLVNIYGDLGTWFGFTPYIGIGAGTARLDAMDFNRNIANREPESNSSWNFAWAYMAGVSYKVLGNSHIDVGYRHLEMGDVTTGTDAFGNQLAFKKVSADEIRVGFRYVLD